jgi:hypothetical protein
MLHQDGQNNGMNEKHFLEIIVTQEGAVEMKARAGITVGGYLEIVSAINNEMKDQKHFENDLYCGEFTVLKPMAEESQSDRVRPGADT